MPRLVLCVLGVFWLVACAVLDSAPSPAQAWLRSASSRWVASIQALAGRSLARSRPYRLIWLQNSLRRAGSESSPSNAEVTIRASALRTPRQVMQL